MSDHTTTLASLHRMIAKDFDIAPEAIRNDVPFTELGLDSLGLVDFVFRAEDAFGVQIEYELAVKDPTLDGFAALIDSLVAEQRPALQSA